MTKEREALKLALEALEDHGHAWPQIHHESRYAQAMISVREALAQPEYEPLEYWNAVEGWVKIDEVREHFDSVGCGTIYKTAGEGREPLYTAPPQRKPLTDEEIADAVREADFDWHYGWTLNDEEPNRFTKFAKAIEAAHGIKEKNT